MLTLPPVRRTLYVERLEVLGTSAQFQAALASGLAREELAYAKALLEAGKLALGGDFEDAQAGSLYVLRAASLAEARELAASRPFTRAGLTRSTVLEWVVRYESPLA